MTTETRPTIGLALSGGGNRSSFYIGFLEVFAERKIQVDYIAACSGGSLVAAAYVCGTLPEFKERVFSLNRDSLHTYFVRHYGKGGIFSIDLLEEEFRHFTKGMNFDEVRPLMGFIAVDIETGEKVLLCMGDIARAARVSCTLPGIFEPVKWGGKTLVDGGLLTMVPGDILRNANLDFTIGVNMRGTKHIFTEGQITAKKVLNSLKKMLFIDEIDSLFDGLETYFNIEDEDIEKNPGLFEVIGKSLDLAIEANKHDDTSSELCDLMIVPDLPKLKQKKFTQEAVKFYYDMGRQYAIDYIPKIEEMSKAKVKAR